MISEEELRTRRKDGWRFQNLFEYNKILQEIFQEEGVPLVIGPYDTEPKNLRVRSKILPITNLDNLRVRNFCAGVDSLEKHLNSRSYNNKNSSNFVATIGLGVDDITKYQRGEIFLQTGFDLEGISYDLNLRLDDKDQTRRIFYKSESCIRLPESFEILNSFIGPKFNLPDLEIYKEKNIL
jgi:hypothetical protein